MKTFLVVLSLLLFSACIASNLAAKSCLELGFNNEILQCQTCSDLGDVISDSSLLEECKSCCSNLQREEDVYESAVLYVDKRFAGPDVSSIIKKKKSLGLKVRYSFGSRPYLHLFKQKDDEAPTETLFIGSWTSDTIEDFLKSHITSNLKTTSAW